MKKIVLLFIIATKAATAQTGLARTFDSLTAIYEKNNFHGVILVAKGDNILYQKAYGYANFQKKIKHTPATEFKIESTGKMFTSTAVMQLIEQNKLKLTQTIAEILPELKIKNAEKITVHQLLTHTSGLQSPWDHPKWKFKQRYTKAQLVKIIEEVPMAFDTPGKEMYYSNSGYYILGWIIEKISGLAYDEYFKRNIFNKLGMTATRHLNDTVMSDKGAQPYQVLSSKKYIVLDETVGPTASPAGGWISTAGDLHKFISGLSHGKLISMQTLEIMKTANNTNPGDSTYRYYAYGFETYINQVIPGAKIYGHNGGGAGFSVDAYFEPASDLIVISCTNLYQNSRPIAMNYLRIALGKPAQPVSRPVTVDLYDLIDSVGIESFIKNEKDHFSRLKINAHPGVFAQMNDAFLKNHDPATAIKWIALGNTNYPEEGFLWILNGDDQLEAGNKAEAKRMYEKAKEVGTKRNDNRVIQAAKEKLDGLGK